LYKALISYAGGLNGEYEKSLEIYTQLVRKNDFDYNHCCRDIIRIYYEFGQKGDL
jgi:hypothetical protein